MKTNIHYIIILFFFGFSVANAQEITQTVRGKAFDKDSKQPLIGATVSVLNDLKKLVSSTDANGNFKITNVPLAKPLR
jgi:CarboxypepD_reg-like domain